MKVRPMPAKLDSMRNLIPLLTVILWASAVSGQPVKVALTPAEAQALVSRALATESRAAQEFSRSHPMRYRLHKSSPRITSTKEIVETRDGDVARLVAINDQPLSFAAEQQEQARLDALLSNPGIQQHRKRSEENDTERALKVLRVLPTAFLYQFAGTGTASTGAAASGTVVKFSFKPNPQFNPPDLETGVLTAMAGEIWIDPVQLRVARLEAHLQKDVDFGWGILVRLNKGGWIVIEQADVGPGGGPDKGIDQWRTVRLQMQMSGRVVFKNRVFDTTEVQTNYAPLPLGMSYQKAIEMLLAGK